MASSSTSGSLENTLDDVSFEFSGLVINDVQQFEEGRKILQTVVGGSLQPGAALGANVISTPKAPDLTEPTPLATLTKAMRHSSSSKQPLKGFLRPRKNGWTSVNSNSYHTGWRLCNKQMKEKLQGIRTEYDEDDVIGGEGGPKEDILLEYSCRGRESL